MGSIILGSVLSVAVLDKKPPVSGRRVMGWQSHVRAWRQVAFNGSLTGST
jgi:hypothetical protein